MTLERLGVPSEDVLGTNYTVTSLTVSDYNPSIDGTVTLTVTVKDVYNAPVVGEEVTVTASDGDFTQLDGSTITAASSVTGTTNSSGQFTLTYACSEWGLITFSANNRSTQVNVTGFKRIYYNNTYELWVDESQHLSQIRCNRSNISIAAGESFVYSDFTIPNGYRPPTTTTKSIFRGNPEIVNFVYGNGTIGIYNSGSAKSGWSLDFIHEWHY